MGGHDDLRDLLAVKPVEKPQERQLPLRRQRAFGFVHQVEPLPGHPLFKDPQKPFAVGMGQPVRGHSAIGPRQPVHLARDAEQAFRLEKPPVGDLGQPARTQGVGQRGTAPVHRLLVIDQPVSLPAAGLVIAREGGQRLDQRGFAGPVLAHDHRQRRIEGQLEIVLQPRQVKRIARPPPLGQQGDAFEVGRRAFRLVTLAGHLPEIRRSALPSQATFR